MVEFAASIEKFGVQGEKTGWAYVNVPAAVAQQLMPGNKKSFRVKAWLDNYVFNGISLIPMGEGNFIFALNATIRKRIGKSKGAVVAVKLAVDKIPVLLSPALMECLHDEPGALAFFNNKLFGSHQKYYSRWIESAKTEATKAKRIAQTITACPRGQHYGEMIKLLKNDRNDLL